MPSALVLAKRRVGLASVATADGITPGGKVPGAVLKDPRQPLSSQE